MLVFRKILCTCYRDELSKNARAVMTFVTFLEVTRILTSPRLVLEGGACIELPR